MLVGLNGTNCRHSCIYCEGFRGVTDKKGNIVPNTREGRWYQREDRSYNSCLKHFQDWQAGDYKDDAEKTRKLKENYFSNKFPPLRILDSTKDATNYIEIFVPPMLHELLGRKLVNPFPS